MIKPFVLIIEDNVDLATTLKIGLKNLYDFEHVDTLAKATAIASSLKPDLILLDLRLPDANERCSFQTARTVFPHIPIVVFSGYVDQCPEIVRCAEAVIQKASIDLPGIAAIIANVLVNYKLKPIYKPLGDELDKLSYLTAQVSESTERLRLEREKLIAQARNGR